MRISMTRFAAVIGAILLSVCASVSSGQTASLPATCTAGVSTYTYTGTTPSTFLTCASANMWVAAVAPAAGPTQKGDVSLTTTASISVITAVASNYLYITSCTFSGTTTTGSLVDLQDGSGGTVIWTIPVPAAAATSAAGATVQWPTPLKVPTIGNALYAKNETSTTTHISCSGYSSTVSY